MNKKLPVPQISGTGRAKQYLPGGFTGISAAYLREQRSDHRRG